MLISILTIADRCAAPPGALSPLEEYQVPVKPFLLAMSLAASPLAAAQAEAEDAGAPAAIEAEELEVEHGKAATADASPVGDGVVEVEIAYTEWTGSGGSSGFVTSEDAHAHGVSLSGTYGIVDDVDVKLGVGFAAVYDAASDPQRGRGLTDLVLGGRWRFLELPEQALELAVTAELGVPSGDHGSPTRLGVSDEFWSARGALVATKDFGALTINAEAALGAPFWGEVSEVDTVLQLNGAVGHQVLPWLQPEVEVNYEKASGSGVDERVLALTGGLVMPFGDGYRVVAAVQHGVWGRNTAQVTVGVLAFKAAFE